MDKHLKPSKLSIDPNSSSASIEWEHWYRTLKNFIEVTKPDESEKLKLLINFVVPSIYVYISESPNFDDAIKNLQSLYCKPINEVYARHKLFTRHQQQGETIDQYLEALKILSKECNFKATTAEVNRDDCIRDAFVNGLSEPYIRQRLLENFKLPLKDAYEQARCLESAKQNALLYHQQTPNLNSVLDPESPGPINCDKNETTVAATFMRKTKCFFCGYDRHPRSNCPARDSECKGCGKRGHFVKVCKSSPENNTKSRTNSHTKHTTSAMSGQIAYTSRSHSGLSKAIIQIIINGRKAEALIDTGSTTSFLSSDLANKLKIKPHPSQISEVSMAASLLKSKTLGECKVNLKVMGNQYDDVVLCILPSLCCDVILGHDLLSRHSKLELTLGGPESPLAVVSVAAANVKPASLFEHLSPNCHPISVKSRRHTMSDEKFISAEIKSLLKDGAIEPSSSPWRAQAFVTNSENHKKRMVIDYSSTINRFTYLDAYPIPNLEEIVNKVANYEVFSAIDLKSAYHQIPIKPEEKHFTAFEACGQLYQFTRIPFGVTNGVAAFQRVIDSIIKTEGLNDTFAYLDDITVCGKTQEEHDRNLKKFMTAAFKYGLTINENKCSFSMKSISLLGYTISNQIIKPDPNRLLPLKNFPLPTNTTTLKRAVGMFSHFSRYIPRFSEKIKQLTSSSFPLSMQAINAFNELKKEIENASMSPLNPEQPFTVETDASDTIIAATLSQNGRPVAFFSRALTNSELKHSSVEKEAYAIVESIRKWRHYLLGRHFKLVTDQKSVSFMFNTKLPSKIKNDKIMRWRLDLSCYSYDIVYRPGNLNAAADSFSRVCASMVDRQRKLHEYHEVLCHPGETRMYHWVRCKNLPYSLDDIRRMTSSCKICAEVKPRFFKHEGKLIKATSPFERLSLDFKGPLPTCTRNRYMLTIVDEYSRFPFAYPCPDTSSSTVISKLKHLFSLFGTPSYVHSDRGSSFLSQELKEFLNLNGIASSRTTAYNPQCNGQVERYNGIIWRTVQLALKNDELEITKWEMVLDTALHSIRSLLCTATNCTPHDRMFTHPRRSQNGISTPTWLMTPGKVLMKCPIRNTKYEPLVKEVTLLQANSDYAHVQLPDGRESTVSTRNLAPYGETMCDYTQEGGEAAGSDFIHVDSNPPTDFTVGKSPEPVVIQEKSTASHDLTQARQSDDKPAHRQSSRPKRLPSHLLDYKLY